MMFGRMGNPDHDDCGRMIHRALGAGVNLVDTADVYGYSETEEIVGKALKGRRDEVVLATKFNGPMGEGPNRSASSAPSNNSCPSPNRPACPSPTWPWPSPPPTRTSPPPSSDPAPWTNWRTSSGAPAPL